MNHADDKTALIRIHNLKKHFRVRKGIFKRQSVAVRAVDGISLEIRKGETLGLVGESGCGKSTAGRTILQLLKPTAGCVFLDDTDLTTTEPKDLRFLRRYMQMIFQDPYASLNPRLSVGTIIEEPMVIHGIGTSETRKARVRELLQLVGLDPHFAGRYPHQFSGGQRQRIGIARALATEPRFIVADEPISALDVSIQAQVVNLLLDLKRELGLTYLFIAHDLSMIRYVSDRVAVMYLGRIVEMSTSEEVFGHPLHPYTQALISAIPVPDPDYDVSRYRSTVTGEIPSPSNPPSGCFFHPRCPAATDRCKLEIPELRNLGKKNEPHDVSCFHADR